MKVNFLSCHVISAKCNFQDANYLLFVSTSCLCLFTFACVGFHLHVYIYLLLHRSVFACLQNELVFTDIITLSLNGAVSEGSEGAQQPSIGKSSNTLHVVLRMCVRMCVFNFETAIAHVKYYTLFNIIWYQIRFALLWPVSIKVLV